MDSGFPLFHFTEYRHCSPLIIIVRFMIFKHNLISKISLISINLILYFTLFLTLEILFIIFDSYFTENFLCYPYIYSVNYRHL